MRYKLRYCLKTDLFTHRENIYKNWDDFSAHLWSLVTRSSEFKCIHVYILPNDEKSVVEFCDEESEEL